MVTANDFKITDAMRIDLSELFREQYKTVEDKKQKLFVFGEGSFAPIKEYYNKLSIIHNNIVYSHDEKPLMSVFAFTGRRALKVERILGKSNLEMVGFRVFKNSKVPMHIDPNYGSTGRDKPIFFIVVSGSQHCKVYISNRQDGSKQVMIPGLSAFAISPTEIEHGGFSAEEDMDIIQIKLDSID